MKIQPLKILNDIEDEKILRQTSTPVDIEKIMSKEIQDFIEQLFETLKSSKQQVGWEAGGIAAIQVGKPIQMFIALNYNHNEFEVFINPVVKELGEKTDVYEEGCLSIPDRTGKVERKKRLKMTYYDRFGIKRKERFSGINARVIMHENDHLSGILYIDKLEQ